eukprot:315937-Chlamydomonas_euryale.AAC.2
MSQCNRHSNIVCSSSSLPDTTTLHVLQHCRYHNNAGAPTLQSLLKKSDKSDFCLSNVPWSPIDPRMHEGPVHGVSASTPRCAHTFAISLLEMSTLPVSASDSGRVHELGECGSTVRDSVDRPWELAERGSIECDIVEQNLGAGGLGAPSWRPGRQSAEPLSTPSTKGECTPSGKGAGLCLRVMHSPSTQMYAPPSRTDSFAK